MRKISDDTMQHVNVHYKPSDRVREPHTHSDCGDVMREIVVLTKDVRVRLLYLAKLKAPNIILYNEAYWLDPNLVPVKGVPQLALWDEWKGVGFVKMERWEETGRKACYALIHTVDGDVLFCPTGRWGPFIKLLP